MSDLVSRSMLHTHGREFQFVGSINIGMGDVNASVKDVRSSEDNVFRTYFIALLGIFPTIEPCQVHHLPCTIGEMSHHPFFAGTHLEGLETEDMTLHLYEGHVAVQFANVVEPASVNMFVGIILQQIAERLNAQFLAEHFFAIGADPRQILDVLLQYVNHS